MQGRQGAEYSLCDSLPSILFHSSPTSPEVRQAQLQLLPGFVSSDVVGGRTSFILGEEKSN